MQANNSSVVRVLVSDSAHTNTLVRTDLGNLVRTEVIIIVVIRRL